MPFENNMLQLLDLRGFPESRQKQIVGNCAASGRKLRGILQIIRQIATISRIALPGVKIDNPL